jgi:tetratricopeptide (TPR) repeat protein
MILILAGSFGCSGEDANQLFQKGVDAMDAKKPDEAVIWFKKALQKNSELALAHYKLGQIYRAKGQVQNSYGHLAKCVELEPGMAEARKEMIFLLLENHALDQVVKVCREYLDKNGDEEEVLLILGNSLAYLKKYDDAVAVLESTTEKYADSIPARTNLAKILVQKGDVAEGRAMLEKLAKENPETIEVQLALVQLYEILESYDLALFILESQVAMHPENPSPYGWLARLSLKKNQPEQAIAVLLDAEKAGIQDSGLARMYGMILHRQGKSDEALEYFKKAVEFAPEASLELNKMILVDYYTFLKQYKPAQEILESIIAGDKTKIGLKSKVVELFLAQGEFDQARDSVDALLQDNSGDARGHYLKGLLMMQDKDLLQAREQFSKAKELAPDAAENQFMYGLTFMDDSEDISITEISESLKKNPKLLKARMALAQLYAKKGDLQASLDELNTIIAQQPAEDKAMALRVSVLLNMKKPQAALKDAKELVESQPKVAWHRFRLAEIYFILKQYKQAETLYEKLKEEKPESIQVLMRMTAISMIAKEYSKAMEGVDLFLTKYPQSSPAKILKARIYLSQNYFDLAENVLLEAAQSGKDAAPLMILAELYQKQGKKEKVLQNYEKALEIAPGNSVVLMKQAGFYLGLGEYRKAIDSYEEVLQHNPQNLAAMNNLAFLYSDLGENMDRALELATAVSKLAPKSPAVADTLGWIYVLRGELSQAEPFLEQAVNGAPDNQTIGFHLGILRLKQNDFEGAKELLESAVEKGLQGTELSKAKGALSELKQKQKTLIAAIAAKNQGNAQEAIVLYEKILARDGFSVAVASDLASLYAEQKQNLDKAMALAQKAYDADALNVSALDALGWVYYHQGSLLMAKQYLSKAIEGADGFGMAHLHLAAVYLEKNEIDAAGLELERAAQSDLSPASLALLKTLQEELAKK